MGFDLREQDPGAAKFNAIAQSVLFALVGCIFGFVAAGLLVGTNDPVGWLIIGAGTAAGALPLMRWARGRRSDQLELFDIDRSLRPLLLRAVAATDRIERASTTAPDGPVSEVLDENHRSALAHVKLLEREARVGGAVCKPELLRSCHQLDDLADASERLLQTTLGSQPTVLNALIERTALINNALINNALINDALGNDALGNDAAEDASTSAGLDVGDREDPGATNDR